MTMITSPNQNHLLASLPTEEFQRLSPHLERAPMRLGEMICASGEMPRHAYFPTTGIVSLHHVMGDGDSAEIAGVGNEGMVGVSLFMGGVSTSSSAVVQTAGDSYRLPSRLLLQEFHRSGLMLRLLLRYAQALMTQTAQTAACNRHHSLLQQLCRWLLLTLDRTQSSDLIMTQELVAWMLGVRREGVTEAAGKLRDLGAISYRRGHITVLDRRLLEEQVCECYEVVKNEFGRLLSDVKYRQAEAA